MVTMLSSILAITIGASWYFFNQKKQSETEQLFVVNEKLINEINAINVLSFKSAANKRAFQFSGTKVFRSAYEELMASLNNRLGIIEESFVTDSLHSAFISFKEALQKRQRQMDQHLSWIDQDGLANAAEKIKGEEMKIQEFVEFQDRSFQNLMDKLESRSRQYETAIFAFNRNNTIGFLLLVISSILLLVLTAYSIYKKILAESEKLKEEALNKWLQENEAVLSMQHNRMQNIVNGTNAGTWEWNVQTGETRFNDRWAEIIGYTLEELAPISIDTWMRFAHPDDLATSNEELQKCFRKETEYYECACRMKHRDGHDVWVLDKGKVMTWTDKGEPEWMFGTHIEITKSKNNELELAASKAFIETVLETLEVGIVVCDENGQLQLFNKATRAMHGLPEEPIPAQEWANYYNLLQEDGITPLATEQIPLFRAWKGEKVHNQRFVIKHAAGRLIQISANGAQVLDHNGQLLGAVVSMHDITEELSAREDLESFASMAAHDLKEPLRMVKGFLERISVKYKDQLDDTGKQYIHFAVDGAERMQHLIQQLLSYARTGKQKLEKTAVPLNKLMKELIEQAQKDHSGPEPQWQIEDLPRVHSNETALQLIFRNILKNALKFQEPGKIPIIKITTTEESNYWTISVQDNGIGIPNDQLKDIFLPFKRLHASSVFEGSGMGLAACKRMIEQLGGAVYASSKEGEGSVFCINIPKE